MTAIINWRALCSAIVLAALAACAAQPLSQKIANGYQLADNYLTRTEMLYDAGAIDNAAAQARLDQVKRAKSGLDAASIAWVMCRAQQDGGAPVLPAPTTSDTPPTLAIPATTPPPAPAPPNPCNNATAYASAAQALLAEVELYLIAKEAKR